MFNQKIKYCFAGFFVLAVFTVFESCAGGISKDPRLKLEIEIQNKNAWLNLMPGDNSTFNFRGKLKVKNTDKDSVKNLVLNKISIYRDSILVYSITPVSNGDAGKVENNLAPGGENIFNFRLPSSIKIKKEISDTPLINAKLVFTSGDETFEYWIKNIKVEKVY